MRVGDLVICGKGTFKITGIYLGGIGTQNLVGLEVLNRAKGYIDGMPVHEMYVPEELVLNAEVYTRE
jgi:hypothetical protein